MLRSADRRDYTMQMNRLRHAGQINDREANGTSCLLL